MRFSHVMMSCPFSPQAFGLRSSTVLTLAVVFLSSKGRDARVRRPEALDPSLWPENGPCGGEGGIRTPGTVTRTPHFECGAFNHSATSPWRRACQPALCKQGRLAKQGGLVQSRLGDQRPIARPRIAEVLMTRGRSGVAGHLFPSLFPGQIRLNTLCEAVVGAGKSVLDFS